MTKVDNVFIKSQLTNQIMMSESFLQNCKLAALKNDGKIDKDEEKLLKKINKCTNAYVKKLQGISAEM